MTNTALASIPAVGAASLVQFSPEVLEGLPGFIVGVGFTVWIALLLWEKVIQPIYRKKNDGDDERRVDTAELLKCVEAIHTIVDMERDPVGKPGLKAVYGPDPKLLERIAKAMDVNQAVLIELKATRGTLGKMEKRLDGIEDAVKKRAV